MNRSFKDYAVSGVASSRSLFPLTASNHRRGNSLSRDSDDRNLDLFSNHRHTASPDHLPDDRTASVKMGRISVGSAKPAKKGSEDLLTNADGGKHDYDWLLTPPETPLFQDGNEFQQSFTAPKTSSTTRSTSTTKSSRLPTNHVESNGASRPARSSSVTRSSSISYSHNNSYSSIRSSSNILNTSSASVSSYIRPSSPATRSSSSTTQSRASTPSRTTTQSRASTPSKARSSSSSSSRPSTPNSRPQITPNSTTLMPSRSSTPTRRTTTPLSSTNSTGRTHASASRPSSPSPRIRQQPSLASSDFPNDTPSNLRTSLPDRPVSVGRSRPNPLMNAKVTTESQGNGSFSRRASSPVVTRGRSVEPKGRSNGGSSNSQVQEPKKSSHVPDSLARRNIRASTTSDNNGFGRSISKKSLDMAIKHMDIRNGPGNARPLAGTVLYPQSIRSGASKMHATLNSSSSDDRNGQNTVHNNNGLTPEKPKYSTTYGALENAKREDSGPVFGRLREVDIFESSRYDAILLKEDLKNTNWLLSTDEKSDQTLLFDHGFCNVCDFHF